MRPQLWVYSLALRLSAYYLNIHFLVQATLEAVLMAAFLSHTTLALNSAEVAPGFVYSNLLRKLSWELPR